ncbi:MAG: ASKHA domain-containing protein [Chloroflexota bacterium]
MSEPFRIDFEPLGRRVKAHPGQTLLEVAQAAGVGLASVCGGTGTCEECRVRLAFGKLTPPTLVEEATLSKVELAAGLRLACQAEPLSDVKLDIPPESLTTSQRLQLEGQDSHVTPKPAVTTPGAYGLAVDIGTTKLAAYLVCLDNGETVARAGAMNPQVAYGEDVISRIAYAGREPDGAKQLQTALFETLNRLLAEMCAEAQIPAERVADAVLVGNTAMHHLFAGLPIVQLGHTPFSPATTKPLSILASESGLNLAPRAKIYLPPVIAGYVGADHLAMLLATDAWKSSRNVIALDIGTNTEISVISDGQITCCSCASGPAFEGAHIHEGMRAAPGAIERARWSEDKILWQPIENNPPVGICGSGILDVVAALLDGNLLKTTGALQTGPRSEYVLVPAAQAGLDREIVVTRKDIHEIQLAKSAIRAGVETLLQKAGLTSADVDEFIVAGAFGTYLDLRSAVRVGMFPPLPLERFRQVGNAAGVGAKQMLISVDKRREAEAIAGKIGYIELSAQTAFTPLFIKHLSFEV